MTDEIKRTPDDDERVSRLSANGGRPKDAGDDIVQEYENRYTPTRKANPMPRSYSTMKVSDDERLWAVTGAANSAGRPPYIFLLMASIGHGQPVHDDTHDAIGCSPL